MGWISRGIADLQRFVDRWWYLPLLALLAAADLFILVFPTDAVVISTAALRPRKWVRTFIWPAIGSATGALILAALVRAHGQPLIDRLAQDANSASWQRTATFLDHHGQIALFLVALSPFPQQPAVALVGLSRLALPVVFASVLIGRAIKYSAFAWAASHAPHLLRWVFRRRRRH